eukprot:CAMPEP_0183551454 /NCGR_PEP_ID=MMETSP0371-20130417/69054_1 /TAXON_ID=268820 /ORGANISM="Peridinium aciculiferum, Strain PAER-2" /LENGTH=34 /DNA_ID= /DNA_START= /DNA_END= /DNA_ORIENTATION=
MSGLAKIIREHCCQNRGSRERIGLAMCMKADTSD